MKVVSLVSGGLDSAVLLHHLLDDNHELSGVSVCYGQRHSNELHFAEALCFSLGVPFRMVSIPEISSVMRGSSQTDRDVQVPSGIRYDDPGQKYTVVPNRNMILLSLAVAEAVSGNADAIAIASHLGDRAIYPDCREEFLRSFEETASRAIGRRIYVLSPFVRMSKKQVVQRGLELGVDFGMTWSCYVGGEAPCGECGACIEREEALA